MSFIELKNVCKRFPLPTGGELEACRTIRMWKINDTSYDCRI